jgi:uncharacterized protein YneF (UPF0154 family)
MNTVILIALAAIVVAFMAGYVRGFWAGRNDAKEESKIAERKKARRLLVVKQAA